LCGIELKNEETLTVGFLSILRDLAEDIGAQVSANGAQLFFFID
jgi:hypothetical protein